MNDHMTISVNAPVDEIELMRALDNVISHATGCNLDDDELMRAVNWLHSKYGGVKDG